MQLGLYPIFDSLCVLTYPAFSNPLKKSNALSLSACLLIIISLDLAHCVHSFSTYRLQLAPTSRFANDILVFSLMLADKEWHFFFMDVLKASCLHNILEGGFGIYWLA